MQSERMTDKLPVLSKQVRAKVSKLRPGTHRLTFEILAQRLDFKLKIISKAKILIASFHGAVNRERRRPPVFNNFFNGIPDAHQISFADPSMAMDKPFSISWFAGHEGFDTQAILAEVLGTIVSALGVERTIYFGSSGGGFAALYFSHCHPGSIVVAGNPQVRILNYSPRLVTPYRENCWPGVTINRELEDVTFANLVPLYAEGFPNTVIYLQSNGDRMHFAKHMLPFAAAMARNPEQGRFILHSDYPGRMGHATTPELYHDWIKAACLSPSAEASHLLPIFHEVRRQHKRTSSAAPADSTPATDWSTPKSSSGFASADLELADRLRNWHNDQASAGGKP